MSTVALVIFFLLFCIERLFPGSEIPKWVLGAVAGVTAIVLIVTGDWKRRP